MSLIYRLQEHLKNLLAEEQLCLKDYDGERLDRIRLAIDATTEQINQATAAKGKQ